jgi:hypothetical protein
MRKAGDIKIDGNRSIESQTYRNYMYGSWNFHCSTGTSIRDTDNIYLAKNNSTHNLKSGPTLRTSIIYFVINKLIQEFKKIVKCSHSVTILTGSS